jgi:hypothetical protein
MVHLFLSAFAEMYHTTTFMVLYLQTTTSHDFHPTGGALCPLGLNDSCVMSLFTNPYLYLNFPASWVTLDFVAIGFALLHAHSYPVLRK